MEIIKVERGEVDKLYLVRAHREVFVSIAKVSDGRSYARSKGKLYYDNVKEGKIYFDNEVDELYEVVPRPEAKREPTLHYVRDGGPMSECEHCKKSLTKKDGVVLEVKGCKVCKGPNYFYDSQLDEEGRPTDVNDVIKNGLWVDTYCAKCRRSLYQYERKE